jgi:hypothetical protein
LVGSSTQHETTETNGRITKWQVLIK